MFIKKSIVYPYFNNNNDGSIITSKEKNDLDGIDTKDELIYRYSQDGRYLIVIHNAKYSFFGGTLTMFNVDSHELVTWDEFKNHYEGAF